MNILLTCAGRRNYIADYFNQALGQSDMVCGADMNLSAPALQACNKSFRLPDIFNPNYIDSLTKLVLSENIHMVFSLNDLEIGLLAKKRATLEEKTGATFYVPSVSTLNICTDKWRTFEFVQEIGIAAPETFLSLDNAILALKLGRVQFPLIIKPRWGSASIGLVIVENQKDLITGFEFCRKTVSKSPLSLLGTKDNVIIQEMIQGQEYGVDILYGRKQNFIGFTAKKKIAMRAGETDKAVTVGRKRFVYTIEKIVQYLPHRGNLDCDFLERDGELYLLEFNPRFGGGYPFTHLAGANHIQMLINDYQGNKVQPYHYETGKAFAKFDSLVKVPYDLNN